jgi:hypothetical protein
MILRVELAFHHQHIFIKVESDELLCLLVLEQVLYFLNLLEIAVQKHLSLR